MSDDAAIRWKGSVDSVVVTAAGRRTRRAVIALGFAAVAVLLLIWFYRILVTPLSLPRPHFIFLSGDGGPVPPGANRFIAQPFVHQEFLAWSDLASKFVTSGPPILLTADSWRTREDVHRLGDTLRAHASAERDLVLVYLTANGFVQEDTAYLRWRFGGRNPRTEELRFQEIVARLTESKQATKILFLDGENWPVDVREHLAIGQFQEIAQQELQRINDPNLWVLMSHSPGEISHLMPPLQQSLFSHAVMTGLNGAADLNGDHSIDLHELVQYVQYMVSESVQQWSNGQETQTPVLLRAMPVSEPVHRWPLLVPVLPPDSQSTPAATTGTAKSAPAGSTTGGSATTGPAASGSASAGPTAKDSSTGAATTGDAPTASAAASGPSAAPAASENPPPAAAGTTAPGAATAAAATSGVAPPSPGGGAKPGATASGTATASGGANPTTAATGTAPGAATGATAGSPPGGASSTGVVIATQSSAPATILPTITATTPWGYAWAVRDLGWQGRPGEARIVDRAPHLWREFECRLLEWEQSVDAAARSELSLWPDELTRNARDFEAITRRGVDRINGFVPQSDLGRRLIRWLQYLPLTIESRSLALNHALSLTGRIDTSPAVQEFTQAFLTAVASSSPAELQQVMTRIPPAVADAVEVRLAWQMQAVTPALPWPLMQQALLTRIRGEQLAVGRFGMSKWIRDEVARGDEFRRAAERLLLDNVAVNRQPQALEWLQTCRDHYDRAAQILELAERVLRTRNSLLYRSPDYVRWWFLCELRNVEGGPQASDLRKIFDHLQTFNEWLGLQQPTNLEQVQNALRETLLLQRNLDALAQQLPVTTNHFGEQYPGGVRALSVILATVLPRADVREQLSSISEHLYDQAWSRVVLTPLTSAQSTIELPRQPFPAKAMQNLMDLQLGLAQLTSIQATGLDRQLKTLQDLVRQVEQIAGNRKSEDEQDQSALAVYHRFRGQFERYIWTRMSELAQTVRQDIHNREFDPTHGARQLGNATRALLVARPSDLERLEGTPLPSAIRFAAWLETFNWLRQRALAAASGASPDEAEYQLQLARMYEMNARGIPGAAGLLPPRPDLLHVSIPTRVDLISQSQTTVTIQIQNLTANQLETWLLLDYDPNLLEIVSAPDDRFYRQPDLPLNIELQPDSQYLAQPTLMLPAGQSQPMSIEVVRKAPAASATRLIVRAITRQDWSRADAIVDIPQPAPVLLQVTGQPNSYNNTSDGITLHPFPNRRTDYTLTLVNPSAVSRKVHLQLIALPPDAVTTKLPSNAYPQEFVRQKLSEAGLHDPIPGMDTELTVPANGSLPLTFAGPPSSTPSTPAASAGAAGAAPPAPPAPAGSSASAGQILPRGALLLIGDPEQQTLALRRIDITPQHPRRYVQLDVQYNADTEQVLIVATPALPGSLPPGPVSIRAEFAEPLPPESNARLSGELRTASPELTLFADVPKEAASRRLQVTVDGYPRAFLYDVPCDATRRSLPEVRAPLNVAITSPPSGSAFPGDTQSIPLKLQVDVPIESLESGATWFEVGLDLNRNRVLDGTDTIVRLMSDREIDVSLSQIRSGGIWSWQTTVADPSLNFPLQGFQNSRRDLLAQLTYGGRQTWSDPVEVVVDGQAPRLVRMAITPPEMVQVGQMVSVLVQADDLGLSGVKQVQLGWDIERTGELPKTALPAVRDELGNWTATLPTKGVAPGNYSLIARITDAVGNGQDHASTRYRILSESDAAAMEAAITGTVTGSVLYGGQPQSGIRITLLKDKTTTAVLPPITTDAQGLFRIADVPQGKYQLKAEGVVRNKRRTFQADVVVDKAGNRNPFVSILLK